MYVCMYIYIYMYIYRHIDAYCYPYLKHDTCALGPAEMLTVAHTPTVWGIGLSSCLALILRSSDMSDGVTLVQLLCRDPTFVYMYTHINELIDDYEHIVIHMSMRMCICYGLYYTLVQLLCRDPTFVYMYTHINELIDDYEHIVIHMSMRMCICYGLYYIDDTCLRFRF